MRVAFLGLGLIGGSIARALHRDEPGRWSMRAWSPSGTGPSLARDEGVIDLRAATPAEAVEGAELVVLAAPPLTTLDLLGELAGPWRASMAPAALITDVASTKSAIVGRAGELGLRFVGGHPMAGLEVSGYGASDPRLFEDRPWIVVPPADDEAALETVERLARTCGARAVRMDAATHDRLVAAVSHLPLVLSAALVEAVAGGPGEAREDWPAAEGLAAGGWASMTRLARGDVAMGAGIVATNASEVASRLRDVRDAIDGWLAELERPGGPDATALEALLADARARLDGPA
jgi:prephenate dehydrogenase